MKVLFVCTANSCRSQMAEAWAGTLFPADWAADSAGLLTCPISRDTRAVMDEVGLDMAGQESSLIDQVNLDAYDLIVTLSKEAGQYLPELTRPERHLKRAVSDPMSFRGPDSERPDDFRRGRDEIRVVVESIVSDFRAD